MVFLRVLTTACLVGLIGLCVSFIGPMVLTPGANQGPMLGNFITGPLDYVAGLIVGWWREKKPELHNVTTSAERCPTISIPLTIV